MFFLLTCRNLCKLQIDLVLCSINIFPTTILLLYHLVGNINAIINFSDSMLDTHKLTQYLPLSLFWCVIDRHIKLPRVILG